MRTVLLAALAASVCAGCACRSGRMPQAFVGPGARDLVAVSEVVEKDPVPPGAPLKVLPLGRTEAVSYHLVQVRTREQPHLHATHDLTAQILKGHGRMLLISRAGSSLYSCSARPMREGDVVAVPRGTIHWFVNEADSPAVALACFAPPFDGRDTSPRHDSPAAVLLAELAALPAGDARRKGYTLEGSLSFTVTLSGGEEER